MKLAIWGLSLSLLLAGVAGAAPAPAKAAAKKPAAVSKGVKKPASVAKVAKPTAAELALQADLKRLMVGNQAGIVKVLGPNRVGVAYARGIDDRSFARMDDEARQAIFEALGVQSASLVERSNDVMKTYSKLPKKEAVAFLATVATTPGLDAAQRAKVEEFLAKVMESDKDVTARRQAILALAVLPEVAPTTTERVLALYEKSENLWETFPVQQYFEYHAAQVRQLVNFDQLRERISSVKSLYTPNVLTYLEAKPAQ
jgi:hypothetical protein